MASHASVRIFHLPQANLILLTHEQPKQLLTRCSNLTTNYLGAEYRGSSLFIGQFYLPFSQSTPLMNSCNGIHRLLLVLPSGQFSKFSNQNSVSVSCLPHLSNTHNPLQVSRIHCSINNRCSTQIIFFVESEDRHLLGYCICKGL